MLKPVLKDRNWDIMEIIIPVHNLPKPCFLYFNIPSTNAMSLKSCVFFKQLLANDLNIIPHLNISILFKDRRD